MTVWLRTSDKEGGAAPGAKEPMCPTQGASETMYRSKQVSEKGCGMLPWEDSENIKFPCLNLPYFHISI